MILFPNYKTARYNPRVTIRFLSVLLLLLVGCTKAPQSQAAVQQAIIDHLAKRSDMLLNAMKVEVVSVSFRDKEADAVVSIAPKEGGAGLKMTYALIAEGGKWVVKPGPAKPHGNAADPAGQLPAGHPPTPPKGEKPAGHP